MPDTQHHSYSDNVALHTRQASAFAPESPVLVCFLLYHLLMFFLPNISLPFHKYSLLLITTKCQSIFHLFYIRQVPVQVFDNRNGKEELYSF